MKPLGKELQTIIHLLLQGQQKSLQEALLRDLLTPQEVKALAERIEIFRSLLAGEPQRTIAQRLGCSIATVTRGSRELQYGTGAMRKLLGQNSKRKTH